MLTASGKAFLAIGVVTLLLGVIFGYGTLVAFGLALLAVTLIGRLWVLRRPRVSAEREVIPVRVRSGRPARSVLTVRNSGRRTTTGGVALESFGQAALPVQIPGLEPGERATVVTDLPTDRRGVFRVGPLDVTRSDPFGLIKSGESEEGVGRLWVHPLTHDLRPFPAGIARDLEGPESGEALEGGVTFHTLREYVRGDDLRLIHWASTARSGKMMVRHNVDTHQPRSLVIFDTRAAGYDHKTFEDAVRAVASIVTASARRNFEYRLVMTDGTELSHHMATATVMDRLAEMGMSLSGNLGHVLDGLITDTGGVSLTVVTGRIEPVELAALNRVRDKFEITTIAQFAPPDFALQRGVADALLLSSASSEDFARSWNQATRL
ncbi:MAG: DUF58 domain-containing protein [Acidimicrobiales bacterium]|nr:DUF58 domain-containing protein [Acidimicrobiia bacterium]NNC80744.1 DUF58 domain-containing protein [Acidimicrobiales bacterium]